MCMQDLRFNCRFTDIMRTSPSGDRVVDFRGFNSVTQNTIMPISFGLSFEETVAVNGLPAPHTTGAPASKGSGHHHKASTKKIKSKSKRGKPVSGERALDQKLQSKSATAEPEVPDVGGAGNGARWRGKGASALPTGGQESSVHHSSTQYSPISGSFLSSQQEELQATMCARPDVPSRGASQAEKAPDAEAKRFGSVDTFRKANKPAREVQEPVGNGTEAFSEHVEHLIRNPTEQV